MSSSLSSELAAVSARNSFLHELFALLEVEGGPLEMSPHPLKFGLLLRQQIGRDVALASHVIGSPNSRF